MRILPNTQEGNHTMKFGMGNIPRLFSKKSKFIISLDQQSKVLYSLILLYVQVEGNRHILKLRYRPLAFTSYKAFANNKSSLPASISAWLLKKNISHVDALLIDQTS